MNVIPDGARLKRVHVASSEVRLADSRHYFRDVVNPESFVGPPPSLPPAQAATLGIWSSGDLARTGTHMIRSAEHVAHPWRYERLEGPGPLDATGGTGPGQRASPGLPHPQVAPAPTL
jgi:hypothetical protein